MNVLQIDALPQFLEFNPNSQKKFKVYSQQKQFVKNLRRTDSEKIFAKFVITFKMCP